MDALFLVHPVLSGIDGGDCGRIRFVDFVEVVATAVLSRV